MPYARWTRGQTNDSRFDTTPQRNEVLAQSERALAEMSGPRS